jgi:hypothetical protein
MATQRSYTKTILNKIKFTNSVLSYSNFLNWNSFGDQLTVSFSAEMTAQQEMDLDTLISSWVDYTTAESLKVYLDNSVFPFTNNLINKFAAENISMGITQAGKTGHFLALFTKKYPVPDVTFQNSLKDSFDTGSLYVSRDIIQYIRDNSSEYSGLSPFITDARLLSVKNEIEVFLGIPLST